MKRLLISILLFLTVAESPVFSQLLKLPVLFQHLAEHQQKDSRISLLDFLQMHYWGDDMDDDDDERDSALPFKKADTHGSHQHFFEPHEKHIAIKTETYLPGQNYPLYQPAYWPNPTLSAPFHPPCV